MAHYIYLGKLTEPGITGIRNIRKRFEDFQELLKSKGGKLLAEYAVFGRHDYVIIVELPNDQAALEISLALGMKGNLSVETCRAFPIENFIITAEGL